MGIKLKLKVIMAEKNIKLMDLAEKIGLAQANLSILRNNKARAIRFSTLEALCKELNCTPGDLIKYESAEKKP